MSKSFELFSFNLMAVGFIQNTIVLFHSSFKNNAENMIDINNVEYIKNIINVRL